MTGAAFDPHARGRTLAIVLASVATLGVLVWALLATAERPIRARDRAVSGPRGAATSRSERGIDARAATSAARRVRGVVLDDAGEPVREGVLSFACLDESSGSVTPIAEAVVIAETGTFDAPACGGVTCVRLAHPALVPAAPWVLSGPDSAAEGAASRVELVARPLLRRAGTVRTPEGDPVAAARVRVLPPGDDDPRAVPAFTSTSTVTDEDGAFVLFRVEHPPCDPCDEAQQRCEADAARIAPTWPEMVIFAQADGWPAVERRFEVDDDAALEITLPRAGPELSGTLVDADGEVYARATILARSDLRPWERAAALVDPDGSFVFSSLRDGPYELRAIQDGVELARYDEARVSEDVRLVGSVRAAGVTLIVRVRDAAGEPASEVRVAGGPFRDARTDASGAVRAMGVLPGRYTLRWGERLDSTRVVTVDDRGPPAHTAAPSAQGGSGAASERASGGASDAASDRAPLVEVDVTLSD
jgi:hypothetical protein